MKRVIIPDDINYCYASADIRFNNTQDSSKFSNFLAKNAIPHSVIYIEDMIIFNIAGTIRPCTMYRFYGEKEAEGFDFLVIEY